MASKLIYTVKEVFSMGNGKQFVIPSYQRGYKWSQTNIEQLLNDINNYHDNDDETFYCLQNITIVEAGHHYNVVDGQQRLTTLVLLLSFLGKYDLIKDKIDYQVRRNTSIKFIKNYICSKESKIDNHSDWKRFIDGKEDELDYQDIYYMFNAYITISKWFEGIDKDVFLNKLLNKVCLIVNMLNENTEEQELFKNLNGGKIDLDGADLIRAIVVTREARKEVDSVDDKLRRIVIMNEKRVRIGNKLDEIARWWSVLSRQHYFDNFIAGLKIDHHSSNQFQNETHPINYLYKLLFLISSEPSQEMSLSFFEKEMAQERLYDKIVELQRIIEDWYDDRFIYHLALFVNIYNEKDFKYLYELWKKNTRQSFIKELKDIIYKKIMNPNENGESKEKDLYKTIENDDINKKAAFSENYYEDNKVVALSVLLDIIDSLNDSLNLPNLKPEYFRQREEDKEHIFPQTPIGNVKDKKKATENLKKYIEMIKKEGVEITITDEEIDWDDDEWKRHTAETINNELMKIIPINSLGNVCLLNKSVNRSYGNDFYTDKRTDIISKARMGYYIRPHVIDAFDKSFRTKDEDETSKEIKFWSKKDILDRRRKVINDIFDFLNKE